ncbi:Rz-like spanin [Escherichia phage Av-05]|uniref:I-spanin n=1 Tax=Escherichia phage Av-05 TaxID=1527519 RepID=A0A076G5L6_9CAUD|nr:Rz-like spanin [Escherichia phage Av-05]AII27546.1 hypothetical protein Av05_003 [Escherichia phage Av-05]
MIWFKTLLTFFSKNIKQIGVVLCGVVLVCGILGIKHWYNDQLTSSYNAGVSDTDLKWERINQQVRDHNNAFKKQQQDKIDELSTMLVQEREINNQLKENLDKKIKSYSKTQAGKQVCLDNQFVDIYNDSLGSK